MSSHGGFGNRKTWMLLDPSSPVVAPLRRTEYQREFAESRSDITLLAAGKGTGKSVGLLHYQEATLWENPGCAHIFTAPTEALTNYFVNEYFRPAFSRMIIDENRGDNMIYLPGGRNFIYRTSGNLAAVEAYTCASGSSDEMQMSPKLLMAKMWARLRGGKRPRLGFVCTPDAPWLKREFEGRDDQRRRCIHASVWENPFVTREWIESFATTIPATLVDAYLDGRFVTPGAAVYANEISDDNVVDDAIVSQGVRFGVLVDFGFRMPHALFVAILPPGTLHPDQESMVIYDEIVGYDITSEQLGHEIKARQNAVEFVACDPAGDAKDARSGESDVIIMRSILRCPFYFPHPGLRPIATGVMRTKTALNPYRGRPRLYITESMKARNDPRSLWNCLHEYSYPKDAQNRAISDVPVKDGFTDHAMDSLRYGVIVLLRDGRKTEVTKGGGL
jgi:hypothetical protein